MTFEESDWSQLGAERAREVQYEAPPRKLFGLFS